MTRTKPLVAIGLAALLVLAGCSSGVGNGTATAPDSTAAEDAPDEGGDDADDGDDSSAGSAKIDLYISDRPIEDFEHLNVTITKVGVKKKSSADGESTTTTVAATSTNSTSTTTAAGTTTAAEEGDGEEEKDGEEDGEGDGEWVTYEVNKTVDLTELKGANATKLGVLDVSPGTYTTVFIYVSDINATLKNGKSANVKLPSNKLQIHKTFEVSANSSVDFVFDLSVFKAGKSGKYILKPVISESGTGDEVEIEDVDEKEKKEDEEEEKEDEESEKEGTEDEASKLSASFRGAVKAGSTATLKVTSDGAPVEGATVYVNGEKVGTTGADGTIEISIPEDAETIEVKVVKGEREVEFEREVKGGGGSTFLAELAT